MNLIVGILLACVGVIWGIIALNEACRIGKENDGYFPLDNAIALIAFFIMPSIMMILCGFLLIVIHVYS